MDQRSGNGNLDWRSQDVEVDFWTNVPEVRDARCEDRHQSFKAYFKFQLQREREREVILEDQKAQNEDRFLRGRLFFSCSMNIF